MAIIVSAPRHEHTPRGRAFLLRRSAKSRARRNGLPYSDDIIHDILPVMMAGLCELSDYPFDISPSSTGRRNPYAPSLDQIVPGRGYVPGNVRVVLLGINASLGDWGPDAMEKIAYRYLCARRPDLFVAPRYRRFALNDNQLSLFKEAA